jgi:hypothetical protein
LAEGRQPVGAGEQTVGHKPRNRGSESRWSAGWAEALYSATAAEALLKNLPLKQSASRT